MEPTFSIDLIDDSDIALFCWEGPITIEDRLKNLNRMAEFCKANRARKLIIDGRNQQSKTNPLKLFDFGAEVPNAFRGLKVAVVHREDDDSLKFIETIASNRGSQTKAFLDFDAARAWLEAQKFHDE